MSGGGVGLVLKPTYLGPDLPEARAAEQRAREAGLTVLRARIVAHIASFKDGWIFRRRLAKTEGCSVRTVQRAITQAREEGLIGVARAKQGEKPPGAAGTFACGWSHRWIIGRGRAAAALLPRRALRQQGPHGSAPTPRAKLDGRGNRPGASRHAAGHGRATARRRARRERLAALPPRSFRSLRGGAASGGR
jgi:hypothetical protein